MSKFDLRPWASLLGNEVTAGRELTTSYNILQHLTTSYNILQLGIALLPLASYYFLLLPHILPASSTLWRLRFRVGGRFGFPDALSVL